MTLMELTIVIAVSGVLLAAVFLLFHAGSDSARRVSESAASTADARIAFDELEERIRSMGYSSVTPPPGWHPLITAEEDLLIFVSNSDNPAVFGSEDMVKIECFSEGGFEISDGTGAILFNSGGELTAGFSYRDGNGTAVSDGELSTPEGRDMVRSIDFHISTLDGGGQILLRGTCSPPNLLAR